MSRETNEEWRGRPIAWRTLGIVVVAMLLSMAPSGAQTGNVDAETVRPLEILKQLHVSGGHSTAKELADAWVAALETALGTEHAEVRSALAALGRLFFERGEAPEAAAYFERELGLVERTVGGDHQETVDAKHRLALALMADEGWNSPRVVTLREAVLAYYTQHLGANHPNTLAAQVNLANALMLTDRRRAGLLLVEVYAARSQELGEDHPETARTGAILARALRALQDESQLDNARRLDDEALIVLGRILGEDHPNLSREQANVAAALYLLTSREGDSRAAPVIHPDVRLIFAAYPIPLQIHPDPESMLSALIDMAEEAFGAEAMLAIRRRVHRAAGPFKLPKNFSGMMQAVTDMVSASKRQSEVLAAHRWETGEEHPDTVWANMIVKATSKYVQWSLVGTEEAEALYETLLQALTLFAGPEHPDTLLAKALLAKKLRQVGKLLEAKQHLEDLLEVQERYLGKENPETLRALHQLAKTMQAMGDLAVATRHFEDWLERRGLVLGREYRSETIEEANILFTIGANLRTLSVSSTRTQDQLDRAFAMYRQGLDACEVQAIQITPAESGQGFWRELCAKAYRTTVALGLELDRPEEALNTLERYRARYLQMLMAWRHSDAWGEIPEATARELASIAERYDALTQRIFDAYPRIDSAWHAEQSELRKRRETIRGELIRARLGGQDIPDPLRVDAMRRQLDPGAVMLVYSLGADSGHVFALGRDGPLGVHKIDESATKLWLQVGRLREMDKEGGSPAGRQALSGWLYKALLSPAQARIDRADRLLIVPDGPLHYLHFAALTRPADDDPRGWRYLIEQIPVHAVQSVSVYAELRSRRQRSAGASVPWQWVGFGDPIVPVGMTAGRAASWTPDVLRSAVERGVVSDLGELLHSRREVQEIAGLFDRGRAVALVDRDATEDRARALLKQARIAHFAVHGLADPDQPMDSFLALSLLGGDSAEQNGLLQAWEIVDQLHLNADLVVLSACETAFGPNRTGEGVISLSRAFQIAGARTVLASQWAVNDASTAELMIRFYRHLLAGQVTDEALRLAQMELIHGSIESEIAHGERVHHDFSAPYYWAAFQLIGDWR